jgi:hypothetical protein
MPRVTHKSEPKSNWPYTASRLEVQWGQLPGVAKQLPYDLRDAIQTEFPLDTPKDLTDEEFRGLEVHLKDWIPEYQPLLDPPGDPGSRFTPKIRQYLLRFTQNRRLGSFLGLIPDTTAWPGMDLTPQLEDIVREWRQVPDWAPMVQSQQFFCLRSPTRQCLLVQVEQGQDPMQCCICGRASNQQARYYIRTPQGTLLPNYVTVAGLSEPTTPEPPE